MPSTKQTSIFCGDRCTSVCDSSRTAAFSGCYFRFVSTHISAGTDHSDLCVMFHFEVAHNCNVPYRTVHILAQAMNLHHESVGDVPVRRLVVSKRPSISLVTQAQTDNPVQHRFSRDNISASSRPRRTQPVQDLLRWLPFDMLRHALSFLDLADIMAFRSCSKVCQAVTMYDPLWQDMLAARWPMAFASITDEDLRSLSSTGPLARRARDWERLYQQRALLRIRKGGKRSTVPSAPGVAPAASDADDTSRMVNSNWRAGRLRGMRADNEPSRSAPRRSQGSSRRSNHVRDCTCRVCGQRVPESQSSGWDDDDRAPAPGAVPTCLFHPGRFLHDVACGCGCHQVDQRHRHHQRDPQVPIGFVLVDPNRPVLQAKGRGPRLYRPSTESAAPASTLSLQRCTNCAFEWSCCQQAAEATPGCKLGWHVR